METFGQVRIRLSEHRHLCHPSSSEAGTPGRFFSLPQSAVQNTVRDGKHGSFSKVKHLREQHVRGRASLYTRKADVGGETLDGDAASLPAPKTIPTSPAYITATITMAVVYCL